MTQIVEPVPTYTKAPCWMQRRWSAHNSRVETIRAGKEVVLKPPCDDNTKPAPATPAAPAKPVAEIDPAQARRVASVAP